MKLGLEAEGRLKGLPTLFLTAEEFCSARWEDLPPLPRIHLLYISDHGNMLRPKHTAFELWRDYPITLEVTKVDRRDLYPPNVTFMLCIESESVWRLAPTDQIKFSSDFQYVKSVAVENMSHTSPEDFRADSTLVYPYE